LPSAGRKTPAVKLPLPSQSPAIGTSPAWPNASVTSAGPGVWGVAQQERRVRDAVDADRPDAVAVPSPAIGRSSLLPNVIVSSGSPGVCALRR
jgi:hypothetical protein